MQFLLILSKEFHAYVFHELSLVNIFELFLLQYLLFNKEYFEI